MLQENAPDNNDYLFTQLQEMFPQIEANVVYMIFSENEFKINEAIEMLGMLSQTADTANTSTSTSNNIDIHSSDVTNISPDNIDNKKPVEKTNYQSTENVNAKHVKDQQNRTSSIGIKKQEHFTKQENIVKLNNNENQKHSDTDHSVQNLLKSHKNKKDGALSSCKLVATNVPRVERKAEKILKNNKSVAKRKGMKKPQNNDDHKNLDFLREVDISIEDKLDNPIPFDKVKDKKKDRKIEFVTVFSYVGVGKWNGLRLIFSGNGNRKPEVHGLTNSKPPVSIFRKKRPLCSSDKLLSKKKVVICNENLSTQITRKHFEETKSVSDKCMNCMKPEASLSESSEDIISNDQLNPSAILNIPIVNDFSSPGVDITNSPISNVLGSSTPGLSQSTPVNHSGSSTNPNKSVFSKTGEPPAVQRSLSATDVYPTSPTVLLQQLPSVMSAPPPHLIPRFPPPSFQPVPHHPPPGFSVPPPYGVFPISNYPPMPMYYDMNSGHQGGMTSPQPSTKVDKIMYVLRGVPGSGKSFLAQQLKGKDGIVLSTDNYFIQQNGKYVFDPVELSNAHQWNQDCANRWLKQGRSPIIIDNTNIESWEMKPYILAAVSHDYQVEIKEPDTWWKYKLSELFKRNSHSVARQTIENMLFRFEKNLTVEKIVKKYGSKNTIEKWVKKYDRKSQQKQNENLNKVDNLLVPSSANQSKEISPSSQIKNLLGIEKNQDLVSNIETKTEKNNSPAPDNKNTKLGTKNTKSKMNNNTPKSQNTTLNKESPQKLTPKKGNSTDKLKNENFTPKKGMTKSPKTPNSNKNNTKKEEVYKSDVERNLARIKSQLAADKKEATASTSGMNQNTESPKMKKRNRPSKPPVPRLLTSPLGGDKDQKSPSWSSFLSSAISDKPKAKTVESPKRETKRKKRKSVAAYTSENDFVALSKCNNNFNYKSKGLVAKIANGGRFKPSPIRTQQGNYSDLTLDKGTSTADLKENVLEADKDIETLGLLFPDLNRDHLVDMYERCDNNVHWSIDVIATSTLYGDNDSLSASPLKESFSPTNNEDFSNDMLTTSTENNSYYLTNSHGQDSEQYLDNEENENKLLNLPKEFLETVIKMATGRKRKVENCEISVTPQLAFQIYSAWKNTNNIPSKKDSEPIFSNSQPISGVIELKQVFSRLESYQDKDTSENTDPDVNDDNLNNQLKEDELLARRLQMEEDSRLIEIRKPGNRINGNNKNEKSRNRPYLVGVSTSLPNIGSPSKSSNSQWATDDHKKSKNLLDIMKEETAAAKSENRQQHANKLKYLGSQMKREQLHSLFPEVPHNLIDDIFIANGCKFDETVHIITSIFSDNDDDFYTTVKSLSSNEDNKLLDRIKNYSFSEKKNPEIKPKDSVELIDLEQSYEEIRVEAAVQRRKMHESYCKATLASHQKKGHLAMYYAQQARLHKTNLRESNRKAATLTYSKMNEKRSSDELDLHGCYVDEAISILKSIAARRQDDKNGAKYLYVITGKGINSAAGVPRVKNAVLHWLETKNMKYTKINDGYLKIHLY